MTAALHERTMRLIITLLLLFTAIMANARQISEQEARRIASEFLNAGRSTMQHHAARLEQQSTAEAGAMPYYVFNAADNAGFVIVSADDRAKKIIGYSDVGTFDFDNMPPQLNALLEQYAKRLAELPESAKQDASWSKPQTRSEEDGVLLETANWGQLYPYNAQCPMIDGVQTPTGCVATAMAIVMKYHNWPEHGRLGNSYFSGFESDRDISTEFSDFHFDYASMDNIDSAESIEEISKLMYACGRAVNMIYHPNGSGAKNSVIGYGLSQYFAFSKDFQYLESDNYTSDEWLEYIHNEIDNHRPVIYSLPNHAHAVVCDGYEDNMVHLNWGWEGANNGFYDLLTLCPIGIMTTNLMPGNYNEEVGNVFVDSGITVPLTNPYSSGIKTNVSKIEPNKPFDIYIETLNTDSRENLVFTFGLCVNDRDGRTKELIGDYEFHNLWDFPNVKCEAVGWNGHSGIKMRIDSLVIKSQIEDGDKLHLLTKDSKGDWIYMKGINCNSFMDIASPNNEITRLEIISNIPEKNYYIISGDYSSTHPGLIEPYFFKGQKLKIHVAKTFDELGRMYAHYLTVDGVNCHRMVGGDNQIYFDCGNIVADADSIVIEIQSLPREELLQCEVFTNDGGEVRSCIEQQNKNIKRIYKLKINGKVNSDDLSWVYHHLPSLEYLDLSESTTTEPLDFNNVDETVPGLALCIGQIGNLKTLMLPANASDIPASTFAYFEPLEKLFLPNSIVSIGAGAFQGANTLRHITLESASPCNLEPNSFGDEFYYDNIVIHVPNGTKEAYSTHPEWGKFKNITEEPIDEINFWEGTVHYVGSRAAGISVVGTTSDGIHFEDIEIIDGKCFEGVFVPVNAFNPSAFDSGTTFRSVKLCNNLVELEERSLSYGYIEYLDLGDGITKIGDNSFEHLWSDYIRFGKKITSIGKDLFRYVRTPKNIYWCVESSSQIDVNDLIHPNTGHEVSMFSPLLAPNLIYDGNATLFVPGSSEWKSLDLPLGNIHEMWSYAIDRISNTILIKPEIEDIVIDNVIINGDLIVADNEFLYNFASNENLDVIVNFTLHNRQTLSTHYTSEFNSRIPDSNLQLVTSLSLNETDATLNEGETLQLTATVSPENASNKSLKWSSSNEAVATVDQSGLITAIAKGNAVITASSTDGSGVHAKCAVIVSEASGISNIEINPSEYVKIYTIQGILVFEGEYSDANLSRGIYIILYRDNNIKYIIH